MYPQLEVYRESIRATRSSTYHLDLPKQGKLSFIMFEYDMNHSGAPFQAGTTGKWRPVDYVNNIDVVANGAKDIISLDGYTAAGLGWWDQGVTMPSVWRMYSSASLEDWFVINFGRKMWDPYFYLQMEDFDSLELRIENNTGTSNWSDSHDITTWLGWWRGDGVPPSHGFLKKEIYRTYTTVQNGREYVDLPTALKIRRVLLQAFPDIDSAGVAETSPANVLYDIRLRGKSGAVTVFDGDWEELMKGNYLDLGAEVITQGACYFNADYGFMIDIGDVRGHAGISGSRDGAASSTVPTIEGDRSDWTQKSETYEGDSPFEFMFRGWGYQNMAGWRFDYLDMLEGLLDPSEAAMGILQLELVTRDSASAADGTVNVVLDRLVPTAAQL
jgi:hypothetical protein